MQSEEYDPDIESFIMDTTIGDSYLQILIEGLEITNNQKNSATPGKKPTDNPISPPKAMLIHTGKETEGNTPTTNNATKDEDNNKENQEEDNKASIRSADVMSLLSGLTKNTNNGEKAKWDEITLAITKTSFLPQRHKSVRSKLQ